MKLKRTAKGGTASGLPSSPAKTGGGSVGGRMEIEDAWVRRVKSEKETTLFSFIKGKMILKGRCVKD